MRSLAGPGWTDRMVFLHSRLGFFDIRNETDHPHTILTPGRIAAARTKVSDMVRVPSNRHCRLSSLHSGRQGTGAAGIHVQVFPILQKPRHRVSSWKSESRT
ncbi:uncharacterized protein CIMG_06335 [Coccidioides immitis RS]|uniref:Uncharacterized protein n=4 Tax=Coccidioides immitis TaxID=5501 RepID=J3K7Y2_COCIM|nr:uncharacterized protein CIMG_06335 [Coccidioides immitis RS]EAS30856.3 hypothetical protein CIMG_06335 [Coccidioides immitis RS]KMP03441.1 hypothetical protein CIRG_03134 [Coccidioides immitis RMSCC 2394]KMU73979.1 hypothetical protein CISG_03958 [Coccidioides immitis RMSCC 3703]KMU82931.1 hypothetical protein CIHG_00714 [Coccidioides immitis H538.4]